jgi:hypothetical protein
MTDVRRFRWAIVAWIVLIATATVFDIVVPSFSYEEQHRFIGTTRQTVTLLVLTLHFLSVLLIALVVQAHPPVGTEAFWMTRPIEPRVMWSAKTALAAVLMVGLPVLAQAVVMAIHGVPAIQIARVGADSAVFRMLWVAIFMTFAALTQGMAQFLLLSGAVLAITAVTLVFGFGMSAQVERPLFEGVPLDRQLADPTRVLLTIIGVALACLAAAALQYHTRLRSRTIPVLILALCVVAGLVSLWPWRTFEPRLTVPAWAMDASRARLMADAGTAEFDGPLSTRQALSDSWWGARARVVIDGMERGWYGQPNLVDASLSIAGGPTLTSPGATFDRTTPSARQAALREALDVRWIGMAYTPDEGPHYQPTVFGVRETDVRRYPSAVGSYRGRFRIDLDKVTVGASLPLTAGASHQSGAYHVAIEQVQRAPDGSVTIILRERDATSVFDPVPSSSEFFLRNAGNAEAIQGSTYQYSGPLEAPQVLDSAFFMYRGSGLRHWYGWLTVPASADGAVKWSRERGWFADAELVIVRTRPVGSVLRTLEISEIRLPSSQR